MTSPTLQDWGQRRFTNLLTKTYHILVQSDLKFWFLNCWCIVKSPKSIPSSPKPRRKGQFRSSNLLLVTKIIDIGMKSDSIHRNRLYQIADCLLKSILGTCNVMKRNVFCSNQMHIIELIIRQWSQIKYSETSWNEIKSFFWRQIYSDAAEMKYTQMHQVSFYSIWANILIRTKLRN